MGKRKLKKFFAAVISASMLLSMLPTYSMAAGTSDVDETVNVTTEAEGNADATEKSMIENEPSSYFGDEAIGMNYARQNENGEALVTFHANGGSYNRTGDPKDRLVESWAYGTDVNLFEEDIEPDWPEGKVFRGWSEDKDAKEPSFYRYNDGPSNFHILGEGDEGFTGNETYDLYAVWADGADVIFHGNGGTYHRDGRESDYDDGRWSYGDDAYLFEDWIKPDEWPEGKVLIGWSEDKEAKEPTYWYDDDHCELHILGEGDEGFTGQDTYDLYAVWGDGATVTFHGNGGEYQRDGGGHDYIESCWAFGSDASVNSGRWSLEAPEGKVFIGWSEDEDAKEPSYWHDDYIHILGEGDEGFTGNETYDLYAVWGDGATVTFHGNGGVYHRDGRKQDHIDQFWHCGDDEYLFQDWTKPDEWPEGKVLIGWSEDKDAKKPSYWYDDEHSDIHILGEGDEGFTGDETYDLYAVWADGARVTFHGNGGMYARDGGGHDYIECCWAFGSDASVNSGRWSLEAPEGKVLIGWSEDEDAKEPSYWHDDYIHILGEGDKGFTGNETYDLYAVWGDGATVTFHGNGGVYHRDGRKQDHIDQFWHCGDDEYLFQDWTKPDEWPEGKVLIGWSEDKDATTPSYWDEGGHNCLYILDEGDEGFSKDKTYDLYAVWAYGTSVTFHGNGGTYNIDGNVEDSTKGYWSYGSDAYLFDWMVPEWPEGKVFMGWSEDKDAKEASYWGMEGHNSLHILGEGDDGFTGDETYDLYAVWADGIPVTFHANGGSYHRGDKDSNHYQCLMTAGANLYLFYDWVTPDYEPDGKVLIGWSEDEEAKEPLYWDEDGHNKLHILGEGDGGFTGNETYDLYAVWEDGATVTFHGNGGIYHRDDGEFEYEEGRFVYGDNIFLFYDWMKPDEWPEGKVFVGWSVDKDAKETTYWEEFKHNILHILGEGDKGFTKDKTYDLYAVWVDGSKVKFHANGGSYTHETWGMWPYGDDAYLFDDWMIPDCPEGKALVGWSEDKNAKEASYWNEEGHYSLHILDEGDKGFAKDKTYDLYAVWADGTSVTFYANGGTFRRDDGEYDFVEGRWPYGSNAFLFDGWMYPYEPEGKVFIGWSEDKDAKEPSYWVEEGHDHLHILGEGEEDFTKDKTYDLYAVYVDGAMVALHSNGGSYSWVVGDSSKTWWCIPYGEDIHLFREILIPDEQPEGKVLIGWSEDENATVASYWEMEGHNSFHILGEGEPGFTPNASYDLYAVWADKVELEYNGTPQKLISKPLVILPKNYKEYFAVTENDTPPADSQYSSASPTRTDAGTYYVWYKIVSDDGKVESEPICIPATIKPGAPVPSDPLREFVTKLYSEFLNREPDEAGIADWVNALKSGKTDLAHVIKGFVLSPEFINKPLSNKDYVTALYHIIFGREPDETGLNAWVEVLENGATRKKVLAGFVNSDEMKALAASLGVAAGSYKSNDILDANYGVTSFVARLYRVCLGRKFDENGLRAWVTVLLEGKATGSKVAKNFLMSPEMEEKKLDNESFVRICYKAFFDRDPDPVGLAEWVAAMKKYPREKIIKGFSDSAEFAALCARYGIKQK